MSETAERSYVTSVKSVAEEILGKLIASDENAKKAFMRNPFIKEYLSSFRTIMKAGYENDRDDISFSHKVISEVKKDVTKYTGVSYATQGAPWMVALAILTEDESIKGLSDTRLRLIFDLAIGIVVEDYHNRYVETLRNAAYTKDPIQKEEIYGYSVEWKSIFVQWERFQNLLREQHSPSNINERF